jgi:aminoglycoside/choline kinase family phosphotransferase
MVRFVAEAGLDPANIQPLAADASFRQYFRVTGQPPHVLMDAPPDKEDIVPFIAVGQHLNALGLSAPRTIVHNIEDGFLLSEDLGDDTFTRLLDKGTSEVDLYSAAIDVLVQLHAETAPQTITIDNGPNFSVPPYNDTTLLTEACLLTEWYLPACGIDISDESVEQFKSHWLSLFDACRVGPEVLVLRDYHVDNLMMLEGRTGNAQVGLLDFQDAVIGPAAYDLVSLLQDCRHCVPPDIETAMLDRYLDARSDLEPTAFRRAYMIMGAQRQTKIIGIFTRLWKRDGKPDYVRMIPYLWDLLDRVLTAPDLADIKQWMDANIPVDIRCQPLPGSDL